MALNTSDKELKSFNFGLVSVLALVRPYIEKRSRNGLTIDIVKKIYFVLGEQDFKTTSLTSFPPDSAKLRRCKICKAEIRGPSVKKR